MGQHTISLLVGEAGWSRQEMEAGEKEYGVTIPSGGGMANGSADADRDQARCGPVPRNIPLPPALPPSPKGHGLLSEELVHLVNGFPHGEDHDMIAWLDLGIAAGDDDLIRPNEHAHHRAAREVDVL